MSFPRYPKYKDSGVEWLGEVPEHWKHLPVWLLFELGRGRVISHEEIIDNAGEFPVYSSQTENDGIMGSLDSYAFDGEYLTWTTDGANAGTVFRRSGKFNCTNVCGTLKARSPDVLLDYCWHALAISTASFVRQDINPKLMNNVMSKIRIPIPPIPEQSAIAAFLSSELAKIDELVGEQRRLIELLKEKRQAVISHAVTKGLNPHAPFKPSGIEWLGDVPDHWEVTPIAHLCDFLSYGFTNPMPTTEEGPYMLTANDVGYGEVKYESARRTSYDAFLTNLTEKSRPKKGDLLITKDGTLGRVAVHDGQDACINQSVASLRVKPDLIHSAFMATCLLAGLYQGRMIYDAGGTTIKHIYISRLAKMPIAYPSLPEQNALLAFLTVELGKLDALTAEAERAIDLLQERRTALISAAVTGKIDVRDLATTEAA